MPLNLFKECGFTREKLFSCIYNAITEGLFLHPLKKADSTTVHKKNNPLGKTNYRPVSM